MCAHAHEYACLRRTRTNREDAQRVRDMGSFMPALERTKTAVDDMKDDSEKPQENPSVSSCLAPCSVACAFMKLVLRSDFAHFLRLLAYFASA
jgi:hypothetical protein